MEFELQVKLLVEMKTELKIKLLINKYCNWKRNLRKTEFKWKRNDLDKNRTYKKMSINESSLSLIPHPTNEHLCPTDKGHWQDPNLPFLHLIAFAAQHLWFIVLCLHRPSLTKRKETKYNNTKASLILLNSVRVFSYIQRVGNSASVKLDVGNESINTFSTFVIRAIK